MPDANAEAPGDPLFRTKRLRLLEIWDRMQRLQTDFALGQELAFYHTSPEWAAAASVVDLGTGNGYYLGKVAARFSDKLYHGVDASTELVALAMAEQSREHVSFSHRSLFDVEGQYDFALMRLLLQHVNDVPAVLDHAGSLVRLGGAALIVDAHDAVRCFQPALPEFTQFFAAYARHEDLAGRDRNVSTRVAQALARGLTWRAGEKRELLIPSTIPGNLELFSATYTLLVDLVEQSGVFDYDFDAVREAWRRWARRPDAYTQVGLNLICIIRV